MLQEAGPACTISLFQVYRSNRTTGSKVKGNMILKRKNRISFKSVIKNTFSNTGIVFEKARKQITIAYNTDCNKVGS